VGGLQDKKTVIDKIKLDVTLEFRIIEH
jgi:hypothetical protein